MNITIRGKAHLDTFYGGQRISPCLCDRTGPPQKTAVQLAAGGGNLEVLEELARYTTQADWLVRQAVSTSHTNYQIVSQLYSVGYGAGQIKS